MADEKTIISKDAMDRASVAPPSPDAGRDTDITERLEADPADRDAKLDRGLDESMDASDPPAVTQPGDTGEPLPSSGYDPESQAKRAG